MFKKLRAAWVRSGREIKEKQERQQLRANRERQRQRAQLTDFTRVKRTFEVEGMFAYEAEVAAAGLRPGASVRLKREFANRYDRNAVAVIGPRGTRRWGYMPATMAEQYAPVMDAGVEFEAVIASVELIRQEVVGAEVTVRPRQW